MPDECDIADGTSQDCNGNGIPDECDIASGFSFDCNLDGVPDECPLPGQVASSWIGGVDIWNVADNWCPFGSGVPNNSLQNTYAVTIADMTSQVTLDISPTLDSLALSSGATVLVGDGSGANSRTLAVDTTISNQGVLRASDRERLVLDVASIIEDTVRRREAA